MYKEVLRIRKFCILVLIVVRILKAIVGSLLQIIGFYKIISWREIKQEKGVYHQSNIAPVFW